MSGPKYVLPASFAQRRLWFVSRLEPEGASYNVPMTLALSGSLDVAALQGALAAIVARHEALRTTFAVADGEPVQVIGPDGVPELAVQDATSLSDAEIQRLVREEGERPFDLESGPLLRATLLRRRADEHLLLVTIHHIVFDGWSAGVFYRELAEYYRAFASGDTPRRILISAAEGTGMPNAARVAETES